MLETTSKRFNRELARFRRCKRAVTAVEFAFVSPLVIVMMLAVTQIGVIYIAQSYLETVAEAGARLALTDQLPATPAAYATEICSQVQALFNCNNLIVSLQPAPTSAASMAAALPQFDTHGNQVGTPPYSVIPPSQLGMLVVEYQWPIISGSLGFNLGGLGNGNLLLVSTQVFRAEPRGS